MNSFTYHLPTKIYFGEGQVSALAEAILPYGKRVLLVYGGGSIKTLGLYDEVISRLAEIGASVFELSGVAPNPDITSVREGVALCKAHEVEVVLAVGGGSVIDCAKFICAGAKVDFDPWQFAGAHGAPIAAALPLVTILTLSATGSEMDNASVISNRETKEKLGRLHPLLLPKASILDPSLTYSVSPFQTACGSVDIISHILEVYFNLNKDLTMLDGIMESLIKTVIQFAPIALSEPNNYEARANLMWASSWAINGFIVGGKRQGWSVHDIEHELSAYYDITHGLGLAILTPRWLDYVLSEKTAPKIASLGRNVFGLSPLLDDYATAKATICAFESFFFDTLGLSSTLSELGIDETYFDVMSKKACYKKGFIDGFVPLQVAEVKAILKSAL